MKGRWKRAAIGAGLAALASAPAEARITGVEILKREPALEGQTFGAAGAYQQLVGLITGELDPADRRDPKRAVGSMSRWVGTRAEV